MTIKARVAKLEAVGGSEQRPICIWEDGDGGEQQIADMLASGKAKPNDNIVVVRWSTPEECELGIASDNTNSRA
jgi:hypothetical protein